MEEGSLQDVNYLFSIAIRTNNVLLTNWLPFIGSVIVIECSSVVEGQV